MSQCFTYDPTIGDIISNRYLFRWCSKFPKRDIYQPLELFALTTRLYQPNRCMTSSDEKIISSDIAHSRTAKKRNISRCETAVSINGGNPEITLINNPFWVHDYGPPPQTNSVRSTVFLMLRKLCLVCFVPRSALGSWVETTRRL